MKTKRKLLSVLITLAIVVSMIPAFGVTASAADDDPMIWWEGTDLCIRYDSSKNSCSLNGYYKLPELSKDQRAFSIEMFLDSGTGRIYDNINRAPVNNAFTIKDGIIRFDAFSYSSYSYNSVGFHSDSMAECYVALYYGGNYKTESVKVKDLYAGYKTTFKLKGTVKIDPAVTTAKQNDILKAVVTDCNASDLTYWWCVSEDKINWNSMPWKNKQTLDGIDSIFLGRYVRCEVTADGYDGKLTSNIIYYPASEAEDNTVKDFYVYITPPVAGQHPQAPTVKTDEYSVSAYNWIKITSDSVTKMKETDVFEEGSGIVYQCRADLLVKDGKVGEEKELTAYVNDSTKTPDGLDVETMRLSIFKVKVTGNFKCAPAQINPFEDVYESDNYYDAVLWAYYASPQVTNGMDETHFGPHLTVTRAQAVTFLWRSQGCPEPSSTVNPFVDVPTGEWYYKPVLWAIENSITKGTTDTTFAPSDTLTTQHMITFLYRTKNPGMDGWYGEAAAWAADSNGKPFGVDIAVNNTTPCPRCNVVQFLYKLSK